MSLNLLSSDVFCFFSFSFVRHERAHSACQETKVSTLGDQGEFHMKSYSAKDCDNNEFCDSTWLIFKHFNMVMQLYWHEKFAEGLTTSFAYLNKYIEATFFALWSIRVHF